MMIALRVVLKHPLEVAKVLRDAPSDKITGPSLGFGPLILIIEARGDRVMPIVRLIDDISDRQLQLMRPEPIRPLEQRGWPHRDRLTSRCVSDSCAASDDSEIPRSRIPLATGNRGSSSTLLSCSSSPRVPIGS